VHSALHSPCFMVAYVAPYGSARGPSLSYYSLTILDNQVSARCRKRRFVMTTEAVTGDAAGKRPAQWFGVMRVCGPSTKQLGQRSASFRPHQQFLIDHPPCPTGHCVCCTQV